MRQFAWCASLLILVATSLQAADIYGLQEGNPKLKSASRLAFGPSGILFIGDAQSAQIVAVQTGDKEGNAEGLSYSIEKVDQAIGKAIGAKAVEINDLTVNPRTGNLFVAVSADGSPAIVEISGSEISRLELKNIAFAQVELSDAPEDKVTESRGRKRNPRGDSITDLAYVDGEIVVSGLIKDGKSSIRSLVFPFNKTDRGVPLEIYHTAHGKNEDHAAMRTFVPLMVGGEPNLLAGFVCTPLVKFPLSKVAKGEQIKGSTVAELGNRNQPLDMIVYEQGSETYLLLANTARGVMKISTKDIENQPSLEDRVSGTAGLPYETIESLNGTVQLDKLNDNTAVVIIEKDGNHMLKSVPLP